MANSKNVEILCKKASKTMCNSIVKKCVQLSEIKNPCVKKYLFTNFSNFFLHLFTNSSSSINNQSFPLFHQAYYNYYLIIK